MQQRELFRLTDSGEDSCVVAGHLANERYLERRQRAEPLAVSEDIAGRYVADDSDLPEFFFRPVAEEANGAMKLR